jgi:hypothetical protein
MSHGGDENARSWRRRLFKSKGSDPVISRMAEHSTEDPNSKRGDGYEKEKAWVETTVVKVRS